jgi:hypothetical protein
MDETSPIFWGRSSICHLHRQHYHAPCIIHQRMHAYITTPICNISNAAAPPNPTGSEPAGPGPPEPAGRGPPGPEPAGWGCLAPEPPGLGLPGPEPVGLEPLHTGAAVAWPEIIVEPTSWCWGCFVTQKKWGQIIQGTGHSGVGHPGDGSSRGQFVQGTDRPGDGLSKGRIVQGTDRPGDVSSWGRIVTKI